MSITVGGLLVALGIVVVVATILGTLFVAFAYGMSDAPEQKMSLAWPGVCAVVGVGLILIGKFSGL